MPICRDIAQCTRRSGKRTPSDEAVRNEGYGGWSCAYFGVRNLRLFGELNFFNDFENVEDPVPRPLSSGFRSTSGMKQ